MIVVEAEAVKQRVEGEAASNRLDSSPRESQDSPYAERRVSLVASTPSYGNNACLCRGQAILQ